MEMRRQGGEGQGTARSASKSRKPAGAETPNTGQQTGGEQDLLQHAKDATGNIVNKVQQQAGTQLNRGKETAATELSQVANAVRRLRENLPQQEMGPLARVVGDYGEKAANSLERLSTYVRDKDPKELLNDVQDFGRRQPALLLGGAFLLGFAGARLIRSSISAATDHRSAMNVQTPTFRPENVPATRPSIPPTV